jgi:glycosyltransferase involved in cell wall biosynthesis
MVVFFPADPRNIRKRFSLAHEAFLALQRRVGDAIMLTGGGISADEMPYYYNAADVVLQTSFCEASPTVVKEALACEVPVVSTDAGDVRDVMEGVPNCVVCGEDPSELAVRLLAVRGRRATGARDRLLAMGLSLDQVAQRIVEVYKEVGVSYAG